MTDEDPGALRRIEWRGDAVTEAEDRVAVEAPLEIRVGGTPIAVVMRTPGHDEALVRGFLLTERIARSPDAIASVRHCTTVDRPEAEDNVVQAVLTHPVDVAALRRNLYASSSCGVCGKASLEQAMAVAEPVANRLRVQPAQLYALPDRLRAGQADFEQTGGVHAAAAFDASLNQIATHEDVGRHNAVDKVMGVAAREGRQPAVLMVSGRVSFEITQKALARGVELVAAVSAPSSLAVELARESGMTLVGFLRDRRMCVYAGGERIEP
ncbi:MAG: formate dehydrogenase accessory sulfurtransferase FdhD [Myxococcota bacterium]